jgi:bifunctional DNase/RNase
LSNRSAVPPPEFRMAIVGDVNITLPSQFPTVVLRETEAPRRQLSFAVGMQDGVGLSHALRRIPTPRPLTHELITDVLSGFDIDVVAIRVVGRQGKTYFAELDLRGRTGRNVYSCRPTDALAIALHQAVPVPILIDSRLFEEEGDVAPWTPPAPAADPPAPAADPPAPAADPPAPAADPPVSDVDAPSSDVDAPSSVVEVPTTDVDVPSTEGNSSVTEIDSPGAETATEPTPDDTAEGHSPERAVEGPTTVATPAPEGVAGA